MAIEFDGTDDFLTCGTADIVRENAALSVYVKFNLAGLTAGGQRIIHRLSVDLGGDGISLAINPTGTIEFEVRGDPTYMYVLSSTTVSTATEHTLILTWDGSATATNVHIYLNGAEVSYTNQDNGSGLTDTSGQTLFIGKISGGTAGRFFNGTMRELAIFSRVITASEITALTNTKLRGVPAKMSNCEYYYTMDDQDAGTSADGDTVADKSGNVRNATGDDGANNTGLTWRADTVLTYPGRMAARGGMWGGS